MNVLLVSIDSLRRDVLGTYRETPAFLDEAIKTPHLDRFADRAAVFESHYAGSLPCMPARREWHTGIQEFLWRPWGPIEPFDSTLPRLAREDGVLTNLITDHYHYFQHGSHGYYEDYNGFSFVRGNEYDAWRTTPQKPPDPPYTQLCPTETDGPMGTAFLNRSQYARNAGTLTDESKFFSPQVFSAAVDWLDSVDGWDRWFCYVDSFDVHEPFHCPEPYASMYTRENPADPDLPVWPHYGRVDEGRSALTDRELDFIRSQFAGTVTMVDKWFGRLLDALDDSFWGETMVIVTSDHGFFLGDSGWIGKNDAPVYDRLGRTPLLVWDPDSPRMGERIPSLTSAVDLYATALETLGVNVPAHVHSRSLIPLLRGDANGHRDWALYGYWGRAVNVTDGRFTYLHPCDGTSDTDCYSTTMLNPNAPFVPPTPKHAESGPFLPYTDAPVWRFSGASTSQTNEPLLYDTESDPDQRENLVGTESTEHERMRDLLVDALETLDAPTSQYDRLDLNRSQSGSKQQ